VRRHNKTIKSDSGRTGKSQQTEGGSSMLGNYFPVLLFVCIGIAMGVVPVMLGKLVSRPLKMRA